jgi:hypothetical protein
MVKRSDVGWLVEPGTREIPRKTLEEAKELLAQGKDYVRHVIRAWLERKRVRWYDHTFQPERLGVEVYIGRRYDRMWTNKAIEAVFYKVALEDEAVIGEMARARGAAVKAEKKASDEDQVDVDVVINVQAPKQAKDIEAEDLDLEAEDIGEDVVEAEDSGEEAEE